MGVSYAYEKAAQGWKYLFWKPCWLKVRSVGCFGLTKPLWRRSEVLKCGTKVVIHFEYVLIGRVIALQHIIPWVRAKPRKSSSTHTHSLYLSLSFSFSPSLFVSRPEEENEAKRPRGLVPPGPPPGPPPDDLPDYSNYIIIETGSTSKSVRFSVDEDKVDQEDDESEGQSQSHNYYHKILESSRNL